MSLVEKMVGWDQLVLGRQGGTAAGGGGAGEGTGGTGTATARRDGGGGPPRYPQLPIPVGNISCNK